MIRTRNAAHFTKDGKGKHGAQEIDYSKINAVGEALTSENLKDRLDSLHPTVPTLRIQSMRLQLDGQYTSFDSCPDNEKQPLLRLPAEEEEEENGLPLVAGFDTTGGRGKGKGKGKLAFQSYSSREVKRLFQLCVSFIAG